MRANEEDGSWMGAERLPLAPLRQEPLSLEKRCFSRVSVPLKSRLVFKLLSAELVFGLCCVWDAAQSPVRSLGGLEATKYSGSGVSLRFAAPRGQGCPRDRHGLSLEQSQRELRIF